MLKELDANTTFIEVVEKGWEKRLGNKQTGWAKRRLGLNVDLFKRLFGIRIWAICG
jgi:hypothetical protein